MRRNTNTDIGKTEVEETGLIDVVKCLMNLRKEVKAIKHSIVSEVKPAYTNQEVMDIFQIASATLKKWSHWNYRIYARRKRISLFKRGYKQILKRSSFQRVFLKVRIH